MTLYKEIRSRYGNVGEYVRRVRGSLVTWGITQRELAVRSGYEETHVSRWLRRRVDPSLETMLRLDEALEELIEERRQAGQKGQKGDM